MEFNTNYRYNSRHNLKKLDEIVDDLMSRKTHPAPADFLSRFNSRRYPEANHAVLGLPGIFKNTEDSSVFVKGNGVLEMDFCESVLPDNEMIFRDAAITLEFQNQVLPFAKVEKIFNYCFYTSILLEKPCYPYVVTNGNYPSEKLYFIECIPFLIRFIVFDKERIYKILNTLSKKDYNKQVFSNEDYLNLIYCVIFAKKPYAKDVVEKAVYLFASIEKIEFVHQLDLHLALYMMIKYHFADDSEKVRELLTVITKAVDKSKIDEVSPYEVEIKSVDEMEEIISQKDSEISHMHSEISQMHSLISQKDSVISQMDSKIKKLEEIIARNKIAR